MKPRLLDLFCKAGGAAVGYSRAGFEVIGVDHEPQPNYPFEFHLADALTFPLEGYDAIHASPPCQAYSRATAWSGDRSSHPDLIEVVQDRLRATGTPYVIENVQEARHLLDNPIKLCGTGFGLPFQSHRYFEVRPWGGALVHPCHHRPWMDRSRDHGAKQSESAFRDALGCPWMTCHEAREAIPPAYTEWLGRELLSEVGGRLVG